MNGIAFSDLFMELFGMTTDLDVEFKSHSAESQFFATVFKRDD